VRLWATLAAALASAVLLWASAPPRELGWLAWIALVPAAVAALAAPATRIGRLAVPLAYCLYLELLLVPALPFGLARDQWGDPVLPVLVGDSPAVFVALVAIPLVGLALYALRFPHLSMRPAAVTLVLVPAAVWTALDLVRVKLDPSGFWGPLFVTQHSTEAGRLAAVAGPWLLTFALVTVNYGVALLVVRRGRNAAWAAAAAVALVVAGAGAASPAREGTLVVAAVQPGYDTSEFERPQLRFFRRFSRDYERASRDIVRDLVPLTRTAAKRGAAIVVWPEAALWVDPRRSRGLGSMLRRLARSTQAALVVPYFLDATARGAAVIVLPTGAISRPQSKQRPMWFLGERAGDSGPAPVDAEGVRVGAMLGVDNQDPASARNLVSRAAELLVSSTHDWRQLAAQQRAFSRLHAAALRVPIVRADWRYGSAIFDVDGRVRADAGLAKRRTVVVAEVAGRGSETFYKRIGDWFAWFALATATGFAVTAAVALRRQRAQAERASKTVA
jgi:apolipoprotein N-acyltransferase